MLADSLWPRFGGDRANRSTSAASGPHATPVFHRTRLPVSAAITTAHANVSGVVVAPDGSLRVCHAGVLSAITLDGALLWHTDLAVFSQGDAPLWHALPAALRTGQTLVVLPYALLVVAADGQTVQVIAYDESLDDSGASPNVTHAGWPVVSSPLGDVFILRDGDWVAVGDCSYGFDVVCPAVYDDDSLAVAGYYGTGFCRVDLNGRMRWQSGLHEADFLPTVNRQQVAAVGSLNDGVSAFFAPDGMQIGQYNHAAVFAEYGDGEWIALSRTRLARLTATGTELWGQNVSMQRVGASIVQPLVDASGYIYARHDEGIRCCDTHGRPVFEVAVPTERPDPVSIIASGVLACVIGHELLVGKA